MDEEDDPYTLMARGINKRWEVGFEPSKETYKSLSKIMQQIPEFKDQKVWGIRQTFYRVPVDRNKTVEGHHYEIVANPQFFHPQALVAQDLTHEEAQALIKILESANE